MGSGEPLDADPSDPTTFTPLAERLLGAWGLRVGDAVHRLVEIEFYSHAPGHEDPFTHRHPGQQTQSRWYFHQEGGSYRGGTFKGLDLTFGSPEVATGILVRTLRLPDGTLVNGSSNCVEHLLRATGHPTVASLDGALGSRTVTDPGGPLQLVPISSEAVRPLATARVGLTLARVARYPSMEAYFGRPYRFLTEPKIRKGKVQTVIALYRNGVAVADLHTRASSTRKAVEAAVTAFERGREAGSLAPWHGAKLGSAQWAEAYGAWVAAEG